MDHHINVIQYNLQGGAAGAAISQTSPLLTPRLIPSHTGFTNHFVNVFVQPYTIILFSITSRRKKFEVSQETTLPIKINYTGGMRSSYACDVQPARQTSGLQLSVQDFTIITITQASTRYNISIAHSISARPELRRRLIN